MTATGIGAACAQGRLPLHHRQGPVHRRHQPSGQAYAYFLRSPHAHARISRSIDTGRRGMPGVLAVLTGADIAADKVGG
jgi:aerobic carbon-monoxide dehydrogenase large subunit